MGGFKQIVAQHDAPCTQALRKFGPDAGGHKAALHRAVDQAVYDDAEAAGMTQSAVQKLGPKERQEELARMLGGVEVSREARAAAKRLLDSVA